MVKNCPLETGCSPVPGNSLIFKKSSLLESVVSEFYSDVLHINQVYKIAPHPLLQSFSSTPSVWAPFHKQLQSDFSLHCRHSQPSDSDQILNFCPHPQGAQGTQWIMRQVEAVLAGAAVSDWTPVCVNIYGSVCWDSQTLSIPRTRGDRNKSQHRKGIH